MPGSCRRSKVIWSLIANFRHATCQHIPIHLRNPFYLLAVRQIISGLMGLCSQVDGKRDILDNGLITHPDGFVPFPMTTFTF